MKALHEIYKKPSGKGLEQPVHIDAMGIPYFFVYSAADFDMRKPLFFLTDSWYTVNEVSGVQFKPFVFDKMNRQIPVSFEPMLPSDAAVTNLPPVWQTSWTSKYLAEERFEKYAAKLNGELIALAAYEVLQNSLVVHIVYIEAHPESNPTLDNGMSEYTGIGRLMIA